MNREEIIKMAHEAGLRDLGGVNMAALERFFHMAQAAEREACAKVAFNARTYIEAAEAIRARGQA